MLLFNFIVIADRIHFSKGYVGELKIGHLLTSGWLREIALGNSSVTGSFYWITPLSGHSGPQTSRSVIFCLWSYQKSWCWWSVWEKCTEVEALRQQRDMIRNAVRIDNKERSLYGKKWATGWRTRGLNWQQSSVYACAEMWAEIEQQLFQHTSLFFELAGLYAPSLTPLYPEQILTLPTWIFPHQPCMTLP